MRIPALLQTSFLPIGSVKLGRLVLNAKHPQQDFLDPPCDPPEPSVSVQDNLQSILSLSKNSQLRSRLTALFLVSHENQDANTVTLAAAQAKTYQLPNSGSYFKSACSVETTRKWFESAIVESKTVYLVVGYYTVTNAQVSKMISTGAQTSGGFQVSIASGSAAVPMPGADSLNSRVNSSRTTNNRTEGSFKAPGEQIFAIQYRKVEFRWYSSRSIDKASLERENRWKTFWSDETRGIISNEEEGEEDDVLEAEITDEFDIPYEESYTSEDGTEEFVF